jgi:glycosyltransferase involved in cell wall biosynthesis
MREADVFLFPCLREEAGAVVAEARAAEVPVVCLDRGGPPVLMGPSGISVAGTGGTNAIARRLAAASLTCLDRRRTRRSPSADPQELVLSVRAGMLHDLLSERFPLLTDPPASRPG